MGKALSAREAKSQKIRDALLRACGDLMTEHSVDALTVNQIVQTAGVAKGSFYNHFSDIDTLAFAASTAVRVEIESVVEELNRNVTDPAYRIARGMCNHFQLALSDPRRATIMMRGQTWIVSVEHPLNLKVEIDVASGVASGRFAQRAQHVGIIQILGATAVSMIRIVEKKLSKKKTSELANGVITLALCGFGLDEEEAARIASDSVADIVGG